jgi:thiamine biosynthesis lipoprotein
VSDNAKLAQSPDGVRPLRRHVFRAMGTTVRLIGPDGQGFRAAVAAVEETFVRLNDRFTRFTRRSELSRVNARAGRWTAVSQEFRAMTRLALDAAARTGGLFDPTVLPALLAAGYDRDFDDIIAGARLALHPPVPCGRWADVKVVGQRVLLPPGVSLDFGGIAKGRAADLAAEEAVAHLPWALVDAGGDLRLTGEAVPPGGLEIAVEDPHDPTAELLRLRVASGGLATSSVTARAWGPGLHHLIDPRTGLPADTGILQATVWAPTCAEAEVSAKWALLAGDHVARRLPAILVHDDLAVTVGMEAAG